MLKNNIMAIYCNSTVITKVILLKTENDSITMEWY